MKNKKAITDTLLGIAIAVIALTFILLYFGPRILNLIKSAPGINDAEANTVSKDGSKLIQPQKEISGQLKPLIVKMEDTAFSIRPTSKDHCLVGVNIKNTGSTSWEDSDKLRASLYCRFQTNKNQITSILPVQNYPPSGYMSGVKPGDVIGATFGRVPNNCLKSLDEYKIVLYSNCQGYGNNVQPCDNIDNAKIISEVTFKCTIS